MGNWRRIVLAAASMLILGSSSSAWAIPVSIADGAQAPRGLVIEIARHRKKPAKTKAPRVAEQAPPAPANEEPGDRARRLMDLETERLERDARRATQSICRGC